MAVISVSQSGRVRYRTAPQGVEVEGQRAAAARDAVQDGSPLGGIKLRFSAHRSFSFSYRYRRLRWRGIFPARIEQDSVVVIPSLRGRDP